MKKLLVLLLAALMSVAAAAVCFGAEGSTAGKVIGYYMDAADDYYKAGFEVFSIIAEREGWKIIDVVGQGTAPEQVAAIENFITSGVDAIITVQNSPHASSECLAKAYEAGVPMFFLTHNPPDEPGLAGFAGYDWVEEGVIAAESAIKWGAKRIIMIEGKLGQGTAGGQTEGFVKGYMNAGLDVGDAMTIGGKGGKDLQIVFWASGGWFADPAKKAMQDAITALGPDGFDGAYVHNDEMLDGALQAFEEAGIDPSKYWLGSSNGKEKSWVWVKEGKVTMDINQTPSLEADLASQQIKAYFEGKPYKRCIFSGTIPFYKDDIDESKLIPYEAKAYFVKRDAGAFVYDLNDPRFKEQPGYKK
ncbi:MAG: sugar ABC transporter substrate-binding protein [Synergistaceae bacterium]|jgi:ABC-type sugar transport system substrate-binding protein|nr:sugar ABC transporter substrate-binding protein [Synergistaceae bacterium]